MLTFHALTDREFINSIIQVLLIIQFCHDLNYVHQKFNNNYLYPLLIVILVRYKLPPY